MSNISRLTNSWFGVDLDTGILYFWDGTDYQPFTNATGYATEAYVNATVTGLIPLTQKGAANGVAALDAGGKLLTSNLPALAIVNVTLVASQAAQLALTAQSGDVAVRSDQNRSYIHNGGTSGTMTDWTLLLTPTDTVLSVNGQTGVVVLSKADIGLSNVPNLSFASGTYTPTVGTTTNTSSTSALVCQWMRVDNVVTVSGAITVQPAAAGAVTVEMALPVDSAMTNLSQCAGSAYTPGQTNAAGIYGNPSSDRAVLDFVAVGTTSLTLSFTYTYRVI